MMLDKYFSMQVSILNMFCFRFPHFTSEASIQRFRGAVIRGAPQDKLKSFIQRALASEGKVEDVACEAKVVELDCLKDMSLLEASHFHGAEIIFTDLPKVNTCTKCQICYVNSHCYC